MSYAIFCGVPTSLALTTHIILITVMDFVHIFAKMCAYMYIKAGESPSPENLCFLSHILVLFYYLNFG